MENRDLERKRSDLKEFRDMYITFVGWVCLGSCFFFGWPTIVVWFLFRGIFWDFIEAILEQSASPSAPAKPHLKKKRCK